jgi:hypothetical protein
MNFALQFQKRSGPIDDPWEKPKTQRETQSGRLVCRDGGKQASAENPCNWFLKIFGSEFGR